MIVESTELRRDPLYVAARELESRVLDARIVRNGASIDVRTATFHPCLAVFLDTTDGGKRDLY